MDGSGLITILRDDLRDGDGTGRDTTAKNGSGNEEDRIASADSCNHTDQSECTKANCDRRDDGNEDSCTCLDQQTARHAKNASGDKGCNDELAESRRVVEASDQPLNRIGQDTDVLEDCGHQDA